MRHTLIKYLLIILGIIFGLLSLLNINSKEFWIPFGIFFFSYILFVIHSVYLIETIDSLF